MRVAAAALAVGIVGVALAVGTAGTASAATANNLAGLAGDNLGKKYCSTNSKGGVGFETSCQGEFWCSDFVKWVWAESGIDSTGLDAWAGHFGRYGAVQSTPHVGDAVLFNYDSSKSYADHVALVTAVYPDGNIDAISGDVGGQTGGSDPLFWSTAFVRRDHFSGAIGYSSFWSMSVSAYDKEAHDAQLLVSALQSVSPYAGWAHSVAVAGGQVYHTIRYPNGTWSGWQPLDNAGLPAPGTATSVTAAADGAGNLQVAAVIDSTIYHRIRYSSGAWSNWASLGAGTQVSASVDRNANVLHMAAVINGTIYHRIRWTDGTWSNWGSLGAGTQVSVSVDQAHNVLQMTGIINGNLYHQIRNSDGSWTGFSPIDTGGTTTAATAAADANGNLQVAEVNNGSVYHRIRYANGTWTSWASLGTGATSIAAAVDNTHNNLQIENTTNGTVYHEIRNPDGTWTGWFPNTPNNNTTTTAISIV